MRKSKTARGWLRALAAAVCTALLLSGCQIGDKEFVISKALNSRQVFKIGRSVCDLKEAKVYLANYQNIYGTAYSINLWEHDFGDESLTEYVKAVVLEELTTVYCMDLLAGRRGCRLRRRSCGGLRRLPRNITILFQERSCLIWEYRRMILRSTMPTMHWHRAYYSLTSDVNEEVSDDEARVMEIMQIFVTGEEKAATVQKKLLEGEDFAAVANNYNEKSAIQVMVSRDDFSDEVAEIVFRLDDGEISQMITTGGRLLFYQVPE